MNDNQDGITMPGQPAGRKKLSPFLQGVRYSQLVLGCDDEYGVLTHVFHGLQQFDMTPVEAMTMLDILGFFEQVEEEDFDLGVSGNCEGTA